MSRSPHRQQIADSAPPADTSVRSVRSDSLGGLWITNWRLGWSERLRGLHYWLGWEYSAVLRMLEVTRGATVVDIGSGVHSIWPVALAQRRAVRVVATDIDPGIGAQRERLQRAERVGLAVGDAVDSVRCDARHLPFTTGSVDAVTAVSTIEHVRGTHGDRDAMREIARILRPGGRAWVTVPFRDEGSMIELDDEMEHFQWHYSSATLRRSLVDPSGLVERRRALHGERLASYALTRRFPRPLGWLFRPWQTVVSALLLRRTDDPTQASAVLLELERPPGGGGR